MNWKKWLAGIAATVIAGILVFWLTEGPKLSHPQTELDQRSINISGRWTTVYGPDAYFSQKGDTITYYFINADGVRIANGNGTISGHFIELIERSLIMPSYSFERKCELSPDQQRMECSMLSPPVGTLKMTLYRK